MTNTGGSGMRKNSKIGLITSQYADVKNTFVYGSGVGAVSSAVRRSQLRYSSGCGANNGLGCGFMLNLGLKPKYNAQTNKLF
jgi:hypothetical protein